MHNAGLSEVACFDNLPGLKFTPDLKWNDCIEAGAKETVNLVGSHNQSKRYLTLPAKLYLFKSQIHPLME